MRTVAMWAILLTVAGTETGAGVVRLSAQATPKAPEIPLVAGLTFVLAVHNPNAGPAGGGIAIGDYEMVVSQ